MAGNPPQLVAEEMDASWIRDGPLSTLTIYALADTSEGSFHQCGSTRWRGLGGVPPYRC